jgi:hypothetical protein
MLSKQQAAKREIVHRYVVRLERVLFPHQESEEEQESFTDIGRHRAQRVLGEMFDELGGTHRGRLAAAPTKEGT